MKKTTESKPCHPMMRDMIEEEIAARKWSEPAFMIAELAGTSKHNAERLLSFDHRLTMIECWMIDRAFGLSEGFMQRFQAGAEKQWPSGKY